MNAFGRQIIFSPDYLQQMLAKVGHSYAVAELGSDKFEPFLPAYILEKDAESVRSARNRLVGSKPNGNLFPEDYREDLSRLSHVIELRRVRIMATVYLTCQMGKLLTSDLNSIDPMSSFTQAI